MNVYVRCCRSASGSRSEESSPELPEPELIEPSDLAIGRFVDSGDLAQPHTGNRRPTEGTVTNPTPTKADLI
jgi:hypothetical protein